MFHRGWNHQPVFEWTWVRSLSVDSKKKHWKSPWPCSARSSNSTWKRCWPPICSTRTAARVALSLRLWKPWTTLTLDVHIPVCKLFNYQMLLCFHMFLPHLWCESNIYPVNQAKKQQLPIYIYIYISGESNIYPISISCTFFAGEVRIQLAGSLGEEQGTHRHSVLLQEPSEST